jgi:CubicO group peptidase (beta-lactamase class C family)
MSRVLAFAALSLALASASPAATAQPVAAPDPAKRLAGFDAYMQKLVKDWNVPGIGVAVVSGDKVIFAKGYGYRDHGAKLPFTTRTVVPIASNTKLFTATAAGLLVEDGKLAWDEPVRRYVPTIEFYDDRLDSTVTIRDMLAHRTGITRHDTIWYNPDRMAP